MIEPSGDRHRGSLAVLCMPDLMKLKLCCGTLYKIKTQLLERSSAVQVCFEAAKRSPCKDLTQSATALRHTEKFWGCIKAARIAVTEAWR